MRTGRKRTTSSRNTKKKRTPSSYIVAIPSYDRPETIISKTLKTLKDGNVPEKKIHIFVANKSEEKLYKKSIPKNLYGKIVVGKIGITEQRKYIINYFPENQKIVSIDDDVEGLFRRKNEKSLEKVTELNVFFKESFKLLDKEELYLWGVYPVNNPFFMKNTVTTDLKFIIGTLYGFINRKDKSIQPSSEIKEKEDYEQSIKYFIRDGGVIRYNDISIKAKKHSLGGLGVTEGRIQDNKKASDYLAKTYPGYVTQFLRGNGMSEVRMSRIARNGKPKKL